MRPRGTLRTWVERTGALAVRTIADVGGMGLLFGRTIRTLPSARRSWRHVMEQLTKIGVGSLAIVALISLFMGIVLAFQSAYQMRKFAADHYIPGLVALSFVREIGPVLTALIVAGRVGASIAAELGTMRVTEQIDALATLATDPVAYLIVPRCIALLVAVPLLTVYGDAIGIAGGYLIGVFKLGLSSRLYWDMTFTPLVMKDVLTGLGKSVIFGLIICIVSCFEGFRTAGGAEGVGRSTTIAVVSSFVLIIAADCVSTALFYFA